MKESFPCEQCDYNGDSTENLENHISDVHTEESVEMTEDEQHFDLYVDNCFSEVYEKFINNEKQINCYFCNYISKCKILRNIQEELTNHLETDHSDIIATYDPDNFDFENDYHQEFLDFFVQ